MLSRRSRARALRGFSAIALLTLAAGCGGGDADDGVSPGGNSSSSFSATVTGGSAGSYSGQSSAASASGLFAIGLSTTDGKFLLSFTRSGPRPGVGTYQLGTNALVGFTASINVGPGQVVYTSTSGTLTITESSATAIKGNFSFGGAVAAGVGAATNASGSFTAVCPSGC